MHKYTPTDTHTYTNARTHTHTLLRKDYFGQKSMLKLGLTSALIKISSVNLILDFQY